MVDGLKSALKNAADDDSESDIYREKINGEIIPAVRDLMLTCGLGEAFRDDE